MSTEPRLLLVGNGWGRDGAPLLLLALAKGYRAAGYALTSAAPGDGPLRAEFAALGEAVSLPDWHGPSPRASFLAAAARLTTLASGCAAVVANTSQALAGVIAARALRLPCVWCVREGADPTSLPFGRWLERACGLGVDLVFEAEAVRRLWAPWLRGPSWVIPNGVPDPGAPQEGDRAAARAALGIETDRLVLVQVGTVCHRKGQDVLLQAAGGKEACSTFFVGEGAPLEDAPGVTWVGGVEDPSPWYRAADVVVSAAREESHPRVVLEAMAHGRAVVATQVGGVAEQVAEGAAGLLVPADDPRGLWVALSTLHQRDLVQALEREGRARYEERFREERMVGDHVALLDRVLRRPGAGERVRRLVHGSGGRGRLARARALIQRLGWAEAFRAARGSVPRRDRRWPEDVVAAPTSGELPAAYVLRSSDEAQLEPGARAALAEAIAADPTRDVVYGDQVVGGQLRLLPGYSSELLLSAPYLGPVAVRRELLPDDARGPHDELLQVCAQAHQVHRVPRVLSWRDESLPADPEAARQALLRRGLQGEVRPHPAVPHALEVRLTPPEGTRAALIVPTRDRGDLLTALRESLRRTTWPGWELVIVDNGSRDPDALTAIRAAEAEGARVIVRDEPFDHSALCNAGAAAAGDVDVLVFLNDDVEVIAPDWLEDLLGWALADGVGAVGARLVYPDGRLQHGGVVLGIGPDRIAGHAHLGEPAHSIGELGLTRLLHNPSAVTGACLAVSRRHFEQVGGFDPAFPTDYNDVDLCLRLRAAGLRTVWTPRAELLHHGGATRPRALDPAAIARFRERWGEALIDDPAYHPLRTRAREDYGFGP